MVQTTSNPTLTEAPPVLPEDLYAHLRDMHPESHVFLSELGALNDLARETGHQVLGMEQIFPPVELVPPAGFSREILIPSGAVLDGGQFKSAIHSLSAKEEPITLDVRHLVTDSTRGIRYVDLRPLMTSHVRGEGPKGGGQKDALDRAFFRDLKFFAEIGHGKNSVIGVPGVNYTKLGKTKARAYWMPVKDQTSEGITTIARIADCRDSIAAEHDIYQRVFHKTL